MMEEQQHRHQRGEALAAVQQNSLAFRTLPERFRRDAEIALAAISGSVNGGGWNDMVSCQFHWTARFIPVELWSDRTFVLAAVSQTGLALMYASPELQADREIVLTAVQNKGEVLMCAAEELQADRAVVRAAVQQNGDALKHASEILRADRDVVLVAVRWRGAALKYASENLQADRDVVLAAMKEDGIALKYASANLRADRNIVLVAVRRRGDALEFASENLQADRDVVWAAVEQDGYALEHAAEIIQNDRDVVFVAVRRYGDALEFASENIRADRGVVLVAVTQCGFAFLFAEGEVRADRDVAIAALGHDGFGSHIFQMSTELRNDPEIVALSILGGMYHLDPEGIYTEDDWRPRSVFGPELEERVTCVLRQLEPNQGISFTGTISVLEHCAQWEQCIWHKIWLVKLVEKRLDKGTNFFRDCIEYAGLPLELRQVSELGHVAPFFGAAISRNCDWRDIDSYKIYGEQDDEQEDGEADGDDNVE